MVRKLSYIYLLIFFLIGAMRNRYLSSFLAGLIIVSPLFFPLFSKINSEIYYLPMMFALGVLFAIHKEHIDIDYKIFFGVILLVFLLKRFDLELYNFCLHITLAIGVVYLSAMTIVKKLKPRYDISYGIYIYAWPIQQLLNFYFPNQNYLFNMIFAIFLTIPFAYLSWVLIESKSIKLGKQLQTYVHNISFR